MSKRDQTPTGYHYAMKALKDRRASLAGEIQSLKNKLAWAKSQLRHVDATLTIFSPGFDPTKLGIKWPRQRVKLYVQGDLSRMVLDALRRAGKPITCQDVRRRSWLLTATRKRPGRRYRGASVALWHIRSSAGWWCARGQGG